MCLVFQLNNEHSITYYELYLLRVINLLPLLTLLEEMCLVFQLNNDQTITYLESLAYCELLTYYDLTCAIFDKAFVVGVLGFSRGSLMTLAVV